MIGRIRALIRGLSNSEAIRYTDDGNRSVVRLDYRALLQELVRR